MSRRAPVLSARRRHWWDVVVVAASAVALLPWIAYLGVSLPTTYVAQNWNITWIGFDLGLVVMLTATAVLSVLRHRLAALASSATGLLLVCDAWFDWSTSVGVDHTWAAVTAAAVELPLAAFLIMNALRGYRPRELRTDSPAPDSGTPSAERILAVRSV